VLLVDLQRRKLHGNGDGVQCLHDIVDVLAGLRMLL
jgi:hypothetical protein